MFPGNNVRMSDAVSEKLARHLEELKAKYGHEPEAMSTPMQKVRDYLSGVLGCDPSAVRKAHVVQFVKEAPPIVVRRIRGLGKRNLSALHKEVEAWKPD